MNLTVSSSEEHCLKQLKTKSACVVAVVVETPIILIQNKPKKNTHTNEVGNSIHKNLINTKLFLEISIERTL